MDDCIFCKIAKNEIPCHKISENDNFLAFLDIKPLSCGHTLVIPKTHYRWVYDVPDFSQYWKFTLEVTRQLEKSLKPLFINYLTMGNQVPHAHIHLIPRTKNDHLVPFLDNLNTYCQSPSQDEFKKILNIINP